jgi:hypothetical protein
MCVASTADFVFAKGAWPTLRGHDIPHARFDTFAEVAALLAQLPRATPPTPPLYCC